MALLIFYVLLALGVSFLCSIMEAVLLSVTPSYVAVLEQQGAPTATRLRRLKDDIDRPLAAILSLNTIAHTVGAAGAGAQAVAVWQSVPVGVVSAVLTLLILVFSEIIPKTLGAVYWKQLTPTVVRLLRPTMLSMWPLVKLAQGLTGLLARGDRTTTVTRAEMAAMAELGAEEGVFEADESRILKSLFRFGRLRVRDVMTPRTVVFMLPETQTVGEVVERDDPLRFSRMPVFGTHRDDITGYVLKDTLLLKAAQDEHALPLRAIRREMLAVPATLPLYDLFERLLQRTEHIALVVDEYGGTEGIVTMEDVVETLLGLEIVDEADTAEDMQVLAREQWRRRARRLGLITDDDSAGDIRRRDQASAPDAEIRFGLTGEHTALGGEEPVSRDAGEAENRGTG
ncbi:MAG: hemolysin family protein [Rhodothermales bacterium]|nr:hemolysin family protein [Rhodothermales bacterium]